MNSEVFTWWSSEKFLPYLPLEFVTVMDYTRIQAILLSKPPTELAWAQVTSAVADKNNNFRQWDRDIFAPLHYKFMLNYWQHHLVAV
jgi:hypothetical protein